MSPGVAIVIRLSKNFSASVTDLANRVAIKIAWGDLKMHDKSRTKRLLLACGAIAGLFLLSGLKVNATTTVQAVVSARLDQIVAEIATMTSHLAAPKADGPCQARIGCAPTALALRD